MADRYDDDRDYGHFLALLGEMRAIFCEVGTGRVKGDRDAALVLH